MVAILSKMTVAVALGDDAVGLDVELLLCAGVIFAFDDEVGGFKGCGETVFCFFSFAGIHEVLLEAVGGAAGVGAGPDDAVEIVVLDGGFGFLDGEDAGEFVVVDLDGADSGDECGLVGMREEQNGLFGVVDEVGGEAGMVFGEVDDGVPAGDVGSADDGELRPVDGGREGDGVDAAAGDGGAYGGAVPHTREGEVVDVLRRAEDLGAALLAKW